MNFAEKIKKQTDRILRQQKLNGTGGTIIFGDTGGGGGPVVVNPNADLARHKTSPDHDSRYYTETEADARFAQVVRHTYANESSIVVAHNMGKRPVTQVVGAAITNYGAGNYGAGNYGGVGDMSVQAPSSIAHNSLNQITVTLSAAGNGEVICIG